MESQFLKRLETMLKLMAVDDIPTICAIGAQNVGKSTILNGLLKLNIFPSRREEDSYNGAKTTMEVTVTSYPADSHSVFFKQGQRELNLTFDNKEEMLTKIYEILNRHQSNPEVLDKTVLLAPEPVHLTIRGPNFFPFHFTDTPGIVSNDVNKYKATTHIVERSIVNKKNTVILFFINSCDDWANTPGWNLVNKEGVVRENVMVVFTKPDSAPASGKGVYESMKKGLDWVPQDSVFVVKGPDTYKKESPILSNEAEMAFFSNSTPHFTNMLQEFPKRVGMTQLTNSLIQKLAAISSKAYPGIIQSLGHDLRELQAQASVLGEAIDEKNKGAILFREMSYFTNSLASYLSTNKVIYNPLLENVYGTDKAVKAVANTPQLFLKIAYNTVEKALNYAVPAKTLLNVTFWAKVTKLFLSRINLLNAEDEINSFVERQRSYEKYVGSTSSETKNNRSAISAIIFSHVIEPFYEMTNINNFISPHYTYLLSIVEENEENASKRRILHEKIDNKKKILEVIKGF